MERQLWRRITRICLAATLVFLLAYDGLACVMGGFDASISVVVNQFLTEWPVVAVLLGMVIGHFVWPIKGDGDPLGPPWRKGIVPVDGWHYWRANAEQEAQMCKVQAGAAYMPAGSCFVRHSIGEMGGEWSGPFRATT